MNAILYLPIDESEGCFPGNEFFVTGLQHVKACSDDCNKDTHIYACVRARACVCMYVLFSRLK